MSASPRRAGSSAPRQLRALRHPATLDITPIAVPSKDVKLSLAAILVRVAVVLVGTLAVMVFLYIERRRTMIHWRGWFVNECLPAGLLAVLVLAGLVAILSML